eukprot:8363620-Alexandrium_andersonii.AAC.1
MSASLVGSEMCIRDRRRTPCPCSWPWPCPGPSRASGSRCPGGRPGTWAVSYTHLTLPTICSV